MGRGKRDGKPDEVTENAPLVVDGVAYYDSDEVPAAAASEEPLSPLVPHASAGRPNACTQAVVDAIIANIAAGGFVHVAAEAAGVSVESFHRWVRLGRAPCKADASDEYRAAHALWRQLANRVLMARAQARLTAEIAVMHTKPSVWLRLGPGRDTGDPDRPGWTNPTTKIEGRLTHEHAHRRAEPVRIDLSRLTDEELRAFERLTQKMRVLEPVADAIDVGAESNDSDGT